MSNELMTFVEYVERERGLERAQVVSALENAILIAAKKELNHASRLRVNVDIISGKIRALATLTVVEGQPRNNDEISLNDAVKIQPDAAVGGTVDREINPAEFGRIAAYAARQAMKQLLRQAERDLAAREFGDKMGRIIHGRVRHIERGNYYIEFNQVEGILPRKEQVQGERFAEGSGINVLLQNIDAGASGPCMMVSRASKEFVRQLFEREVSEIRDGLVKIRSIARVPGVRTKIAVSSTDPQIDPVGACVGVRGTRVRRITDEIFDERIDIIPYDEDITKYVANALLPGKISEVEVDEEKHELLVVASEQQSKVVFGRNATNVKLAGLLVGWHIKICNENHEKQTIDAGIAKLIDELAGEAGIPVEMAQKLVRHGFNTVDGLLAADAEALAAVPDIDHDALNAAIAALK